MRAAFARSPGSLPPSCRASGCSSASKRSRRSRSPRRIAPVVIISVYSSVSGENPRRKYRQRRSVQSIMGATETRRSTNPPRFSTKRASFTGFSINGVSASFLRIRGSLGVAQFTLHESWNELKRYTNLRHENLREIPIVEILSLSRHAAAIAARGLLCDEARYQRPHVIYNGQCLRRR